MHAHAHAHTHLQNEIAVAPFLDPTHSAAAGKSADNVTSHMRNRIFSKPPLGFGTWYATPSCSLRNDAPAKGS